MITNYTVSGMTCEHCVNHVTEEVGALDGVQSVDVKLDGGTMAVTSDSEVDFAKITEAVAEAGDYTVAKA
ncbi:heavy-metal-associated domain-containing protein [Luteococcus sediminum]|uniref:heavy-metal-associated domain-containing protein n=1 Tax=Luteococcus sp. TaxID=1969402 RepID=UPI003736821D